jgi:F-type H+-transporting ATPase subunit delta
LASKVGDTGIASRYALALFELADQERKLDEVAEDLRTIDALVSDNDDLQRLLRNPVVSRSESGKVMAAVLDRMEADPLTQKFIGLVAANRRLFVLRMVIKAFLDKLAERRGEITAEVVSANALTAAQAKSLEEALHKAMGGKIALSATVDPGLIGGLVVKVGSRMVDSSIRTQIQKMKLAMKGAA